MIKLIRFLLGLCNHKWEVYEKGPVSDRSKPSMIIGFWTRSNCTKCGNHKYKQHF